MKIQDVQDALHLVGVDPEQKKLILAKLEELENDAKAERALIKAKKGKKQYVVVLKSGDIDLTAGEIVSSVWVIDENDDPSLLFDKIRSAAVDNNLSARKAKNRLFQFSQILSFIKPKFLKGHGVKKLSKDWERTLILTDETVVVETPFSE